MATWLKRFWPRLLDQLNRVNGAAAVGALVLTVGGFVSNGWARGIFFSLAALLLGPLLVYAIRKAWPPKVKTAGDVEGEELLLPDLAAIHPPVPAIGIIGPSRVGKTTLRDALLQEPTKHVDTDRVTARISSVFQNPTTFVAVIDGKGQAYSQQFAVAESCDVLVVLLDHSSIDAQQGVDETRLERHRQFGEQVREHLTGVWRARPRHSPLHVHVLLNKKDEWESKSENPKKSLEQLLEGEVVLWRSMQGVSSVTSAGHSNARTVDITALAEALKMHWSQIQGERSQS